MSVIFWTADNFKSTYKFDRFNFQPIVLFDGPVELDMLAIFKNIDDKKSYILTLYTKTFQIHIDRDNISIIDDKSLPDENIEVNDDIIKMNLYDRTFIKGILEQINPKFYITNKILPKKEYYTSINRNRYNTNRYNPYENPFNTKVVPFFNNAFDNPKSVYDEIGTFEDCSTLLRQCDIDNTDE